MTTPTSEERITDLERAVAILAIAHGALPKPLTDAEHDNGVLEATLELLAEATVADAVGYYNHETGGGNGGLTG